MNHSLTTLCLYCLYGSRTLANEALRRSFIGTSRSICCRRCSRSLALFGGSRDGTATQLRCRCGVSRYKAAHPTCTFGNSSVPRQQNHRTRVARFGLGQIARLLGAHTQIKFERWRAYPLGGDGIPLCATRYHVTRRNKHRRFECCTCRLAQPLRRFKKRCEMFAALACASTMR